MFYDKRLDLKCNNFLDMDEIKCDFDNVSTFNKVDMSYALVILSPKFKRNQVNSFLPRL